MGHARDQPSNLPGILNPTMASGPVEMIAMDVDEDASVARGVAAVSNAPAASTPW